MDLDLFFSYENQSCPPSLSGNGELRTGKKSDLTNTLAELINQLNFVEVQVLLFMMVQPSYNYGTKPRCSKTFGEYCESDFEDSLLRHAARLAATRIDLIWDIYADASLKNGVRQQRGSGTRRQVSPETKLPRNWPDFLWNERNKKELLILHANYALHNFSQVHAVTNVDKELLSSDTQHTSLAGTSCEKMESACKWSSDHASAWYGLQMPLRMSFFVPRILTLSWW